MTPLAHAIARELCLPASARTMSDKCSLAAAFLNPRCFECTALLPFAESLTAKVFNPTHCVLLPAPETWIEFVSTSYPVTGLRVGYLVSEINGGIEAEVRAIVRYLNGQVVAAPLGTIPIGRPWLLGAHAGGSRSSGEPLTFTVALLSAISASSTDRREHTPHIGLQKRLGRAMGLPPGTLKLLPWSEIRLVAPIGDEAGRREEPTAAQAPGGGPGAGHRKAHHFCRSHMRSLKNGKIVPVRAHMRGDPALGTKRTWYSVQPRSPGAATP